MEGVTEAGGIPVMLSLVNDDGFFKRNGLISFDGFIFAGGDDLNPAIISSRKSKDYCGNLNAKKEMKWNQS